MSNDYRRYPAAGDHRAATHAITQARQGGAATRSESAASAPSPLAIAKARNSRGARREPIHEPGGSAHAFRRGITAPPVTAAARLAAVLERRRALEAGGNAGPTAEASAPNCRTNIGVIEKWEMQAEDVFAAAGNKAQCRTARAEAEMLCKGCPFVDSCAERAKHGQYTGIAGGRIFINGRNRLTPSGPTRIVA